MTAHALAGFAYGVIEKAVGDKIPEIPVLGKAGTIAVACHYLGRGNRLIQDAGSFAAGLAGYQLGTEGKVTGETMAL